MSVTISVCISLQKGQVFVWPDCLLKLGMDFFSDNMVFVWGVENLAVAPHFHGLCSYLQLCSSLLGIPSKLLKTLLLTCLCKQTPHCDQPSWKSTFFTHKQSPHLLQALLQEHFFTSIPLFVTSPGRALFFTSKPTPHCYQPSFKEHIFTNLYGDLPSMVPLNNI